MAKDKVIDMHNEVVIANEDGSETTVVLRPALIKDIDMANQLAAAKCQDPKVMGMKMPQELLRLLIVSVNGKQPTSVERENLDELFTLPEYVSLMEHMQNVMGKSRVARQSFVKNSGGK